MNDRVQTALSALPRRSARRAAMILSALSLLTLAAPALAQVTSADQLQAPSAAPAAKKLPPLETRVTQGQLPPSRFYRYVALAPQQVNRLPPLGEQEIRRDETDAPVARIGVVRPLTTPLGPTHGARLTVPGGEVSLLGVVTEGARRIRVHFTDVRLPAGAKLYVYSMAHPEDLHGPYEGLGPFGDGEFWTPPLEGDGAVVEYFIPEQAAVDLPDFDLLSALRTAAPPFRVSEVSHTFTDPATLAPASLQAGSCHPNVPAAWASAARAVGALDFISGDGSSEVHCTGTLLNSQAGDLTPYMLTANHCLSTEAEARTTRVWWFFDAAGQVLANRPRSDVATLLSTRDAVVGSDYTLLMIRGGLPSGLTWAGWTTSMPGLFSAVVGIHHPNGDSNDADAYKRIAYGDIGTSSDCNFNPPVTCGNFLPVDWDAGGGGTEPGSSGSGLWRDNSTNPQLVGQLLGGRPACNNPFGLNSYYGRFDLAFNQISGFLAGGSDDGLEQNDSRAGSAAVSANSSFGNLVVKSVDEDWYRVSVPSGGRLTVTLNFEHDYGDIDLEVYRGSDAGTAGASRSTADREAVDITNTGGTSDYFVRAYLFSSTRNTYSMQVSVAASAAPVLTQSLTLSPAGPYTVGQTVTGRYAITNRGGASVTFDVLTIGGRLNNDSTVRDFPWHRSITLSPGQTYVYQNVFQFTEAGNYRFFPAYRTLDGVWRIGLLHEIPADPGVGYNLNFNVASNTIQVTVQTSPAGRSFTVDGTTYSTAQTFNWTPGSGHTISTTSPQNGAAGTRYVWNSWSDGGAVSHTVAPSVSTTYTANFTTQHFLTMNAGSGGTVSPASNWFNAGQGVTISAAANSGFTFGGWTGSGSGSFTGANNPASVTINGPITQTASFTQNRIQVTVQTNPSGRSFTVDGITYATAQSFLWVPGSSHTIGTASPQNGAAGTRYLWSSWSDGGAISHTVAPTTNASYTANFITQHFLTMVAGAGGTVSPASNWFNAGQGVGILASPGAGFLFNGWTGAGVGSFTGASNPASVTMNGPITQTAFFRTPPPNDFSISAAPSSRTVTAGGSTTFTVSTATTSGSAQNVALSLAGLPAGASGSFSPSAVTSGGSSTLTVNTSASTPPGTYPLTVSAAGSVVRTAGVTLVVNGTGGGRNVALAVNGATASASSELDNGRLASAVINGDRRGLHWGSDPATGSGWHDATGNFHPDWVQVNFAGNKTINQINVFTIQDNFGSPVEPSDAMTFGLYGITAFEAQYWNGSSWVTVPGGSVAGNNRVKRAFVFAAVTTSRIRVLVHAALASYSRVIEVEAFETTAPPPTETPGTNVALASNGAVASASSELDNGRLAAGAINGDRRGLNWGSGGGWHDATGNLFPDWLQVDFAGSKTINQINVFTIQDNFSSPAEPGDSLTFGLYGVTAFDVQYWNGAAWVTVPGGSVAGNNLVKRTFVFPAVTTGRIRVLVNGALAGYSRLVEVEALTPGARTNLALASNGGVASASSELDNGRLASGAINGDRRGLNWGGGGGWHDATGGLFPDWLQVHLGSVKTISEVGVYTIQDDFANPVEPTDAQTFGLYGVTAFDVQYWNGASWVTVPGGSVTGNNRVKRTFAFAPVSTDRVRVLVNNALAGYSRITEVEVY